VGAGKRRPSNDAGDASRSQGQALSRLRGAGYFVDGPSWMGALEAVDTGCAGGVAGVTGISGETGGAAAGAVMGVTVTPVTLPVTASFCSANGPR